MFLILRALFLILLGFYRLHANTYIYIHVLPYLTHSYDSIRYYNVLGYIDVYVQSIVKCKDIPFSSTIIKIAFEKVYLSNGQIIKI